MAKNNFSGPASLQKNACAVTGKPTTSMCVKMTINATLDCLGNTRSAVLRINAIFQSSSKSVVYLSPRLCVSRAESRGAGPDPREDVNSLHHPGPARPPAGHRCCPQRGVQQAHSRGRRQEGRDENIQCIMCSDISVKTCLLVECSE